MSQDLLPDFAPNSSQRTPVVLVLDTSSSMAGPKLQELSAGLQTFQQTLRNDDTAAVSVELAIVTFGSQVRQAHDFATAYDLHLPVFEASGQTPLGEALDLALDLLEARKQTYRQHGIPYFRPWLMLITDGEPTDGYRWPAAAERLQAAESAHKLSSFVIGVEGANMSILKQIAHVQRPPLMLQGMNFRELFLWLSASVQAVSHSQGGQAPVELPPVSGWAQVSVN